MNNLKRILCLVMVFAMCMGTVISASAASYDSYSDADQVTYEEAMDVLVAIGIIDGQDGKLAPTDYVTREQAAKMIAYACIGKTAADALSKTGGNFGDVAAGRWSAGYISYCASKGIINGVGDMDGDGVNDFNPSGNITGYAFVKMLLSAIGYGANGEFTGEHWATNTASYGFQVGAFSNSKAASYDIAATREEAMLYAFNILTGATTVSYSELFSSYYTGSTPLTTVDDDDEYLYTLGYKVYGLYQGDTAIDDFGRQYYEWEVSGDAVSDKYYTEATLSYTTAVSSSTLYTALGKSYAGTATYILDGVQQSDFTIAKGYTSAAVGGRGVLTLVYADDDTYDVTIVSISTYLAVVTGVDDDVTTVTVYDGRTSNNVAGSYDYETAGFSEDEYVLVTIADGEIQSMAAADSFTGIMSTYASSYLKINGTTYYKSATYGGYNEVEGATDYYGTYLFYTDSYGNLLGDELYEEADAGTSNYVYVTASEYSSSLTASSAAIAVQYLDGTYGVMSLNIWKSSGSYYYSNAGVSTKITASDGAALNGLTVPGFYRYTTDSDGEVTLKAVSSSSQSVAGWIGEDIEVKSTDKYLYIDSSYALSGKTVDFGTQPSTLYLSSSTVLKVIDDDGDVTTVTGYSNIKGYSESGQNVMVLYSGSIVQTIYVFGGTYTSSDTYALGTGSKYTTSSGTFYTFYIEGESVAYELDTGISAPAYGTIYSIARSSGVVTALDPKMTYSEAVKVTSAKSSYFVAGGNYHYYDEDAEIYSANNSGAAATISVGDYVVFVKENGLVVSAYIVSTPSTTPSGGTTTNLTISSLAMTAAGVTFTDNLTAQTVYLVVESFTSAQGYTSIYTETMTTTAGSNTSNLTSFASGTYRITVYADSTHSTVLAQAYANF